MTFSNFIRSLVLSVVVLTAAVTSQEREISPGDNIESINIVGKGEFGFYKIPMANAY